VLSFLEEQLGDARLFVVGTGPHMRQETLLRLAERGRGAATFAGTSAGLEKAVTELFESISDPLGWDVGFDWEGSGVEEIQPSQIPDLYAGRPVRVLAHVRGDLPSALALTMTTLEGERRFRVTLPPLP
jgi:Ca-activated chloride channel family protein